jgi:hypothetical protein
VAVVALVAGADVGAGEEDRPAAAAAHKQATIGVAGDLKAIVLNYLIT